MAGHSKYANIKHRKNAQDSKRSKVFTKISRQIQTAAKRGIDPKTNVLLRIACEGARSLGLSRDRIEAAIERMNPNSATRDEYESLRYNAVCGEVNFVIEVSTNNRNRTAPELRTALSKYGGQLTETGSADYLFNHIGLIEYSEAAVSEENLMEAALELNALDMVKDEKMLYVKTKPADFHHIMTALQEKFGDAISARLYWEAANYLSLSPEKEEKVQNIIELLEDIDDVDEVYCNVGFQNE